VIGKEQVAKVVRVLSVPPVMITALVLILANFRDDVYRNYTEVVVSILLLGIVPVLAYVLQRFLPGFKDKGREGQRKLAFITNLIGYSAAFIWAILINANDGLMVMCSTYFFSVIILFYLNKGLHFKASGHASSFTGPLLMLVYKMGWIVFIPCVLLAVLIFWSSIYLKRHTTKELIAGILVCFISFCLSLMFVNLI